MSFVRNKAEYAIMFGAFFEAFARNSRIGQGIRRIGEVQSIPLDDFIQKVRGDLISIERNRWGGKEGIWELFKIQLSIQVEDARIYTDDYVALHFVIYELLKNAYMKLAKYYGVEYSQTISVYVYDDLAKSAPWKTLAIRFENLCPYNENIVECFRELRKGIRLSLTGGSGVGLFCCGEFLRRCYYGDLRIHLEPPGETECEGRAVFEIIIPKDIREVIRYRPQQISEEGLNRDIL